MAGRTGSAGFTKSENRPTRLETMRRGRPEWDDALRYEPPFFFWWQIFCNSPGRWVHIHDLVFIVVRTSIT